LKTLLSDNDPSLVQVESNSEILELACAELESNGVDHARARKVAATLLTAFLKNRTLLQR